LQACKSTALFLDALLGHTGGNPKIKYSEILRLIADEYEQIGK